MDLLVAIPAAMGLGILHFLEPGHGKGVLTAYLISSRAKLKDAVLLGFTSAIAHTFSILLLALLANSALQFWLPQQVEALVSLVSGATITVIGARMVLQRLFPPVVSLGRLGQAEGTYVCSHGHVHHVHELEHDHRHFHLLDHEHTHEHTHDHHHDHDHFPVAMDGAVARGAALASKRRLFLMGVLTGLIPCPSALVMLLAAASAGKISFGIGLVGAFSLGGALSLSLLGILLLKAENKVRHLERRRFSDWMASVSAMIIVVLGLMITYTSLTKFGLL